MNYPPQGYGPPPAKKGMSTAAIVLIVIVGLLMVGGAGCAACVCIGAKGISDAKDKADAKKVADTKAARAATVTVSVADFIASYRANELAADNSYKGKYVRVTGATVLEIRKAMKQPELWLNETGDKLRHPIIHCQLTPGSAEQAAALAKGAKVTVVGRGDGMIGSSAIGSIFIKDCELSAL